MTNYEISKTLLVIYLLLTIILGIIAMLKKWSFKEIVIVALSLSVALVISLTLWAKLLTVKAALIMIVFIATIGPLYVKLHWEYLDETRRLLGLDKINENNEGEDQDQGEAFSKKRSNQSG